MIIVLTGIDGSGKSTAAQALVSSVRAKGGRALLLSNHAGRRVMSLVAARLGVRLPARLSDAVETALRVGNALVSHLRASRFDGLVVMDRHLHCQLALRSASGLPRGRFLPWLLARLPQPDAVIHLNIDPAEAHRRIVARGTDSESLDDLAAFQAGYRDLPEYAGFVKVDASAPKEQLLAELLSRLAAVGVDTDSALSA
ncbi:AAA family ATPase [Arthrobacter sp. Soil764]|uniref:AAA family ATPase n=1 Tax=Arthrobacter sp. Soil764 TaxID=1736403 RepID=UPI0006FF2440|nr:AAA family ATPase [Arthrobacter sp. Soil764]KRE91355.1 thymidylate kinase [Arthrobacter sp. Soil764]